jgi:hypothetical protein
VVLPALQGKGPERKEASLLKAFLVTFVATKVTGPPAAKSGYAICHFPLYGIEIASFLAMTHFFQSNKKTRPQAGFFYYPERSIISVLPAQALCFRLFCR